MQWSRQGVEEATWEREDALKKEFPHLFKSQSNLEDEIHFKWGRFVTSEKFTRINCSLKMNFKIISKFWFVAELPKSPETFPIESLS